MPDFEGANIVELQPEDVKVPVQFKVTVCTAASTNDGFLPFGYTVVAGSSASGLTTVTAVKYPGSTSASGGSTDLIDGSIILSSSIVTVPMTWPTNSSSSVSILGAGTYHLTFKFRLSGVTVRFREANFNRVFARDK